MDISLRTIEIARSGKEGLICKDNIRADIKVTFIFPSGGTIYWQGNIVNVTSSSQSGVITASGTTFTADTSGNSLVRFRGVIQNGSTAGNLQFQFAQNVADATTPTVVKALSFLKSGKF